MKGINRLLILIAIAIIGGIIVVSIANAFMSQYEIDDTASRATIVAGVLVFLGTVFATIYKEISTYYKDKNERGNKKWELALPMIKKNYMPWISAANSLSNSFKSIQTETTEELTETTEEPTTEAIKDSQINRIMFLFTIFYGIRLKNLQENGGYILLSTTKEEEEIAASYEKIKNALNWAGVETPNRINELQEIFVKNEKKDSPYSIVHFEEDLNECPTIQDSKSKFEEWLTPERARIAQLALEEFVKNFKNSINRLSSYWDN